MRTRSVIVANDISTDDRVAYKKEALEHGYRIAVAVSETEIAPGVDTPQDLEAVRRMLA